VPAPSALAPQRFREELSHLTNQTSRATPATWTSTFICFPFVVGLMAAPVAGHVPGKFLIGRSKTISPQGFPGDAPAL
jgi:hypothetical protein